MINNIDCLEHLKVTQDKSYHTIFADPPYNLGSSVLIDKDGKPKFKGKAKDFMGKWQFGHEQWEQFFKESFRTLKCGGYLILYGMDRQEFLLKYYAVLAGFEESQSLYWYFLSSFPKATDASKMIDKRLGKTREVVGKCQDINHAERGDSNIDKQEVLGNGDKFNTSNKEKILNVITAPASPQSTTMDGYKYGIAPFKQVVETILIFRKPPKNKSVLNDLMAWQDDSDIAASVVDIDGNMVGFSDNELDNRVGTDARRNGESNFFKGIKQDSKILRYQPKGRYPSQLFCSPECGDILDKQSGVLHKQSGVLYTHKGGIIKNNSKCEIFNGIHKKGMIVEIPNDSGGCSRILHKPQYETEELDLLNYFTKAPQKERHAGLDGKNPHPTIKPIKLNKHIACLFKLPKECNQKWLIPFGGCGSELIALLLLGIPEESIDFCEISEKYCEITKKRVEHYLNTNEQHDLFNLTSK